MMMVHVAFIPFRVSVSCHVSVLTMNIQLSTCTEHSCEPLCRVPFTGENNVNLTHLFLFLSAELLVDKAMQLKFIGGVHGGNVKPSPFLCLVLKMLQIQPEKDIILEFIRQQDFK